MLLTEILRQHASIVFHKPIKPSSYYIGRFGGALVLNIMVQMTASIGLFIGFLMPYLDQEGLGHFDLMLIYSHF